MFKSSFKFSPVRVFLCIFKWITIKKWLGTLITWKRFLSSMGSSVQLQRTSFRKWLGTLITRKKFLSHMRSMLFQIISSRKWLRTLITRKWFLSSIDSSMSLQRNSYEKRLKTLITWKRFLSSVDFLCFLKSQLEKMTKEEDITIFLNVCIQSSFFGDFTPKNYWRHTSQFFRMCAFNLSLVFLIQKFYSKKLLKTYFTCDNKNRILKNGLKLLIL